MTIQQNRTCANCASFCAEATGGAPECWNAISFIEHQGTQHERHRAPGPSDVCYEHTTRDEDAQLDELLDFFDDASTACQNAAYRCGSFATQFGAQHPAALASWYLATALDSSGVLNQIAERQTGALATPTQPPTMLGRASRLSQLRREL